jgi:cytosine/adenosine deaminase-related metal-dependent hydrolase
VPHPMSSFTLRARWVLPIETPPIEGGYVAVVDGRIAAVDSADPGLGAVHDLGDVVLMPGLVNAHTHLEFSDFLRPVGASGISLPAWIRLVISERKRSDRDIAAALPAGLSESLAAGITTIGEIATAPAALYAAPKRPTTLLFQEAIGFSSRRVDSVYTEVQRRLDQAPAPAGLSPHAPYTVHPRLLERLVELAGQRGTPVAMHLAESREELQLLERGDGPFRELLDERSMWDAQSIPRGTRPLDYLRVLARAPRSLVIHGNYLTADEIDFIAARRDWMSVVFCPRTHAYFQHPPYPLEAMLRAGVRVVLGTDSRASNPDLDILKDLALAQINCASIPPAELLRMVTLEAAIALGLDDLVGSLSIGKRADLVALPIGSALDGPYQAVLAASKSPRQIWLAGRPIGA